MKLFISYSHSDKDFVYLLEATLFSAGIDTFLDEKDIKIGESIPEMIYKGIEESSFLVYVVSTSSLNSKWVNEELSIAKVLEKEKQGFRILPLIIDEIKIPTSIAHLKYADFRAWKDPYSFRHEFLKLLSSIGVAPLILNRDDYTWYIQNSEILQRVSNLFVEYIYRMRGAGYACQSIQYSPKDFHLLPYRYTPAVKIANDFFSESRLILSELTQIANNSNSPKADKLIRLINQLEPLLDEIRNLRVPSADHSVMPQVVDETIRILYETNTLIENLRLEVENILYSKTETSSRPE